MENVEGKSPNRHNRFYFTLEPLADEIVDLIKKGEVSMNQQMLERRDVLIKAGMEKDEAKSVKMIKGTNMLIDATKGIQYLNETMELVIEGIHEALAGGPLADEPVQNLKMVLTDVKLHEMQFTVVRHRSSLQSVAQSRAACCLPATRSSNPSRRSRSRSDGSDGCSNFPDPGTSRQVFDMTSEGDTITVAGKAPVAELFGFAGDIRSATEGRAMWNTEFIGFELVPNNMVKEVVVGIRKRKGLKEQMPTPADYLSA